MDIYNRIDDILAEKKLSRRKLAQQIGVAPSTFQSMMSRKRGMSFDVLMKIVTYLQVPASDFYRDEILPEVTDVYKERLDAAYSLLNDSGRQEAVKRVEELAEIPKYSRATNPENK